MPQLRSALSAAALATVAATALTTPTPAAAQGCTGAADDLDSASPQTLSDATLCLLNQERRHHGLRTLRSSSPLGSSAGDFAGSMVAQRFFSHKAPDGSTPLSRIRKTGYLSSASSWATAENIGFGTPGKASPRGMVRRWMHSAGHRRNILDGKLRDIGIGIAGGTPTGGAGGVTYVTDFGRR